MNTVHLIGNVGADPQKNIFENGSTVVRFSVASNAKWKNKNGETVEQTTWFRVSAWGKLGEICEQYIKKGDQVYIIGSVTVSPYIDKNGKAAASLEIRADQVKFLSNNKNVVKENDDGDMNDIPF